MNYTSQNELPFFSSLFDFSFDTFVTQKLVRVIYILELVLIALLSIGMILGGFAGGFGRGLLALIFVPIFALILVIFCRIGLELAIVMFRIADNTRDTARAVEQTPTT